MKNSAFTFLIILFTGVGVSAQKDFDPEYESIKSRVSYVPGIKVIRGETQTIVPRQIIRCPAGTVFKFNNGDIQVYDRRSSDGGKTWNRVEYIPSYSHCPSGNIYNMSMFQYPEPDGEVLMVRKGGINHDGVHECTVFRSKDNGLTWHEEIARIFLPEKFKNWTFEMDRGRIVMIDDGSLIMDLYGGCKEKCRGSFVAVIRSTDRGRTWHYLSTVAFGLTDGVRSEGFNEPTLLVLPDGKIICFMRSGVSYQGSLGSHNNNDPSVKMPFGAHKSTPVYMSKSIDGGRTWSNADPITEKFGVWPDAVLMQNGIIAVSYGRPGNWLMFSKDEGESWGPIIPFYNDLYPPDCSNYVSLAEVAPDILLAVYARTDPNDHWQSEIVGTYFHIKRDDE